MNYVVFDLEWNQATRKSGENQDLPFEIIEIGAVKLNDKFEKIGEFSRLIRPSVYHTMHGMTADIVHLSMRELRNEQPFGPVCRHFLKWCGEDVIFGTWGPLDLTELQRNMTYFGFPNLADGPIAFYDIQKLYALTFEPEDEKKRRALNVAVEALGLEDDIPFHRAFGDAYYTAKVFKRIAKESGASQILKRVSYDVYHIPKDRAAEVHVTFDKYSKYISREFESKFLAMEDAGVTDTKCYKCGRHSKTKIAWFTPNGKNFLYLGYCWRHGFLKGKIRIRKTTGDRVFVIKTLKLVTRKQAGEIRERQNKLREARREKRREKRSEHDDYIHDTMGSGQAFSSDTNG